jgi:uncharacterized protein (DUF2235 family)
MLDRTQGNTFHYYRPVTGTYITSPIPSNTQEVTYDKARASTIGTAFADHAMGSSLFLMRYYALGDDIYFFGLSRDARFLAEMPEPSQVSSVLVMKT